MIGAKNIASSQYAVKQGAGQSARQRKTPETLPAFSFKRFSSGACV